MDNRLPASAAADEQKLFESMPLNYTQWREQFILTILRVAAVLGIGLIVTSFPTAILRDRIFFIGLYLFLVAMTILPVSYTLRASALLLINFAIGANAIIAWGPWADGTLFLLLSIVLASLLFDRRVDLFILSIGIFFTVGLALLQQSGLFQLTGINVPATERADWIVYCVDFSLAGALIVLAVGQFKDAIIRSMEQLQSSVNAFGIERAQLEKQASENANQLDTQTAQLHASTAVSRILTRSQNITDLFEALTLLVSEKFAYYHVGLYLVDEHKKTVFLQAASSEAGKSLVGQFFRVEPGKRSAINTVVERNLPVLSSEIGNDFIRDANFPLTRSRMMVPLAVRDNVLGFLDMHSEQNQAFNPHEVDILQSLANLAAIACENLRLIDETKNLLAQLEIDSSLQTQQSWENLTSRSRPAYRYTPAGVRPFFSKEQGNNESGLRVPLTLHGQTIGAIKLRRKGITNTWSERERILVEKIADQVALALENSRLVEEAQKSALRDQVVTNISGRIRETLDVESVIRTAASELQKVFDLKEAEISVGSPTQTSAIPGRKHTSSLRLK